MSKTYTLFKRMSPYLARKARNLVDAMLMSENQIGWDIEHQLIANGKVQHGSDIVKLVSYVMSPADSEFRKPIGLKAFTTALKEIGLESDYVVNRNVKKVLEKNNESDSENEESIEISSEDGEEEASDNNSAGEDEESNEDETDDDDDDDDDDNDFDDGTRNHSTKKAYKWKTMSGSENESDESEK